MRYMIFAMLWLLAPVAQAQKPKIVCWTDEHGVRACGDRVPVAYAKSDAQLDREARLGEEARKQEATQAAYDRYLIQTFGEVSDLVRARDERLGSLDGQLTLARKAIRDGEKNLDLARQRSDAAPADAALAREAASYEAGLNSNRRVAGQLGTERTEICGKYAADILRFQTLRTLPATPAPACPVGAQ